MDSKKVIMFDFDGVLVNTLSHAFQIHKELNDHFTWEEYDQLADGNFHEEYKKKIEEGNHIHPKNYPKEYNKRLQTLSMEEMLIDLVKKLSKKYHLYIVSSSRDLYIKKFLEKIGISDNFNGILGYDIDHRKISKIKSILEKENIASNNCLFITDTIGDIKEARECRVDCIGVLWGLHSKEKLEKERVFRTAENPIELEQKIEEFFTTT